MVRAIRIGKAGIVRIPSVVFLFLLFSYSIFGQQPTCNVGTTAPTVHAEGLAEQISDISFSCSGGAGTVTTVIAITLNANITNRLDSVGNVVTGGTAGGVTLIGAGVSSLQPPTLNSPKTIFFSSVQLPGASATFTISGLRVALPSIAGGSATPIVNGSIYANQLNIPSQTLYLAQGQPTLLSSVLNNGVPCGGSPATPLTGPIDFNALVGAGTASSTVRVTEASPAAFVPALPSSDFGVRFLVSLSGYGPNAQVYVPDVIVGNLPASPTSAGAFSTLPNGGTYSPNNNQLLLTRVAGADATGAGGTLVLQAASTPQSFTSVSQVPLVNGAGTVTYEVLAANGGIIDSAQIPVFVVVPAAAACPDSLQNTLSATLAPASTVAIPTQIDPIPRYIATTPASDCALVGDCAASYFPVLGIAVTSISLSGASQGKIQQSTTITVNNTGGSQMNFNVSIAYQTGSGLSTANWLSANTTGGVVEGGTFVPLIFSADPTALLIPGTYHATATINAGSAGTVTLPVTFTVGPAAPPTPPPPTIQSVVNSANLQAGPITAGSFATLFGSNLAPKTSTPAAVTFAGANATVIYDGPTQMNVVVPASLGSATTAGVVATIDGVASSSFTVNLAPNAPAVFNPGIENQDYSVNSESARASVANSDIIQIFLTGLATPVILPVTVNIGSTAVAGGQITYAGAVTGVPGLEQVNVRLPSLLTFTGDSAQLSVCVPGATAQQPICSATVPVYLH